MAKRAATGSLIGGLNSDNLQATTEALKRCNGFLDAYEKLCLETGYIVDAGIGEPSVAPARESEIRRHIKCLRDVASRDADMYAELQPDLLSRDERSQPGLEPSPFLSQPAVCV